MRNLRVSADRIGADITALAAITDPGQPWTRRAFSPRFDEGRAWLANRFAEAGLSVTTDAGGNLLGMRKGSGDCGTILLGSHSDTVPDGGRFDGVAGVIVALEVARMLSERGLSLRHDLCVADFLAEEVSVFGVSCIGSRAMAGVRPPEWLALTHQGRTLEQALTDVGGDAKISAQRTDIKAFFELHIEQGPVLESTRTDLGLVTAIAGITRIEVILTGRPDHAGTAPMYLRADALVGAAQLVTAIEAKARAEAEKGAHFTATVGEFSITPGAANVVPGGARLLIDARAVERAQMEGFLEWLRGALKTLPQGISAQSRILSDNLPTPMHEGLIARLEAAAETCGASHIRMASGAGHDAAFMARIAPAAMIFVPCKEGRSHCPEEWAETDDIALGAEVMAEAVLAFDAATQGEDR
ncbi:N-carbamoyl-L-amino-acid hydrolase [Rhodobacter viridis]|uniref:N-carbamoyl-L-amino-acid hydrolase n=1 Tax=Rhodobacter viridis TaxID=1054202 RepID=A0A318U3A4_9RHOB|nr:Zn-dependent hydrolase [Rhodobacter viridis]PYF09903.1 N-carbamoyl-L-amino-acid hydrolase [Rhodobacter viridis]